MGLKIVMYAYIAVLLCITAYAQEETAETCASRDGSIATSYNPENLMAIFGTEPACINGAIRIGYAGENSWNIGHIYGNIETSEGSRRIIIENGGLISNPELEIKTNLTGQRIALNGENSQRMGFTIENGIYSRYNHSISCESSCTMAGILSPTISYLNLTGNGIAGTHDTVRNRNDAEKNKTLVKLANLNDISVRKYSLIMLTAESAGRGAFGSFEFSSADAASLVQSFAGSLSIEKINAQNADIYITGDSNAAISPYDPQTPAQLSVFMNDKKLLEITSGKVAILASREDYDRCAEKATTDPNTEAYYKYGACFFIEDPFIGIMPRQGKFYINNAWAYKPLEMALMLPVSAYKEPMADIEYFAKNDAGSRVVMKKQYPVASVFIAGGNMGRAERIGRNNVIVFSRDNVEEEEGNWYDMGTSFEADVYNETEQTYYHFECNVRTRKCFLDNTQVSGFTEQSLPVTCTRNSGCGEGRKCIPLYEGSDNGKCVREAACGKIDELNAAAATSDRAADVVFIGDGYADNEKFMDDVRDIVDANGARGTKGILSLEPFNSPSNREKIIFWAMNEPGAEMPLGIAGIGMGMDIGYINKFKKQCPGAEHAVVISKTRNYLPDAQPYGDARVSIPFAHTIIYWTQTIAHEFGHAFGGLQDEYLTNVAPITEFPGGRLLREAIGYPNCMRGLDAEKTWNKLLGEGKGTELKQKAYHEGWFGCGGSWNEAYARSYIRPSFNSIMRHQRESNEEGFDRFNDVDIAHLQNKLNEYAPAYSEEE